MKKRKENFHIPILWYMGVESGNGTTGCLVYQKWERSEKGNANAKEQDICLISPIKSEYPGSETVG